MLTHSSPTARLLPPPGRVPAAPPCRASRPSPPAPLPVAGALLATGALAGTLLDAIHSRAALQVGPHPGGTAGQRPDRQRSTRGTRSHHQQASRARCRSTTSRPSTWEAAHLGGGPAPPGGLLPGAGRAPHPGGRRSAGRGHAAGAVARAAHPLGGRRLWCVALPPLAHPLAHAARPPASAPALHAPQHRLRSSRATRPPQLGCWTGGVRRAKGGAPAAAGVLAANLEASAWMYERGLPYWDLGGAGSPGSGQLEGLRRHPAGRGPGGAVRGGRAGSRAGAAAAGAAVALLQEVEHGFGCVSWVSWVPWCYFFYAPSVGNLARYLYAASRREAPGAPADAQAQRGRRWLWGAWGGGRGAGLGWGWAGLGLGFVAHRGWSMDWTMHRRLALAEHSWRCIICAWPATQQRLNQVHRTRFGTRTCSRHALPDALGGLNSVCSGADGGRPWAAAPCR
jgi:hypothetical protein